MINEILSWREMTDSPIHYLKDFNQFERDFAYRQLPGAWLTAGVSSFARR